jgi:hypothetical protein
VTRTDQALYLAAATAALAVVLAVLVIYLWVVVRRLRANQRLVTGTGSSDLVEYAVGLLARVEACEQRFGAVESSNAAAVGRIDGCLQRHALLRYDALEGSGGKQSATIAVTDAAGSGVVLSAIQGRDYARIYIKDVREGTSDVELSPEEQRALEAATAEP